jgi:hypothetical protein
MLKINLLPPYIYEGSTRKKVMALWAVIVLAVIGGFLFWKVTLDQQVEQINADRIAHEADANAADKAQADANNINAASAKVRDKAKFIGDARDYNVQTYPRLVYNIRDYTLKGVLYDALTPQGNMVQLPAYAPDLATVGHYIMAMERNPEIDNVSIQIGTIPGYPPQPAGQTGNQGATGVRPPSGGGHNFIVTLALHKPIPSGPTYPLGAAPAGGGGGGMGGGMMGSSGMMSGGSGMMGSPGMMSGGSPGRLSGMGGGGMMGGRRGRETE